jgi:hypothetical protein
MPVRWRSDCRSTGCFDGVNYGIARRPLIFRAISASADGTFSQPARFFGMTDDYSVRPPKILTSEERKVRDAVRRADAEQAMREHEAAQKAFYQNRERLRALRLAREASERSASRS